MTSFGNPDPDIALAVAAMQQHPGNIWTLETLAEVAGISRSSFAQKFKQQMQRTPNEYLLNIRMQQAESLLKGRGMPLKEIARMAGYRSVSAFSTAYKRWSGKSPRRQRQAENDFPGSGP